MTQNLEAAERIVTIQNLLQRAPMSQTQRTSLTDEQRRLWDSEHKGRSYDAIEHDVWALRRYP